MSCPQPGFPVRQKQWKHSRWSCRSRWALTVLFPGELGAEHHNISLCHDASYSDCGFKPSLHKISEVSMGRSTTDCMDRSSLIALRKLHRLAHHKSCVRESTTHVGRAAHPGQFLFSLRDVCPCVPPSLPSFLNGAL